MLLPAILFGSNVSAAPGRLAQSTASISLFRS